MKAIYHLSRWLSYISMSMVALMTFLTVIDVIGRYLSKWFSWASPVTGTPELTRFMMVITVFLGLSWCAITRKHLKVDLFVNRLPQKAQTVADIVAQLFALAMFVVITWQSFIEATKVVAVTSLLQLPQAPFYWIMAFGLAVFCLSIVVLLIETISGRVHES
jgi:TRAP-type C4-dicarboxylate transport system permease small subunit